jgi:hypothetical protein
MLHELRFYEIKAARIADDVSHASKVAVPFRGGRDGKRLGFSLPSIQCQSVIWSRALVPRRIEPPDFARCSVILPLRARLAFTVRS